MSFPVPWRVEFHGCGFGSTWDVVRTGKDGKPEYAIFDNPKMGPLLACFSSEASAKEYAEELNAKERAL